MVIVSTGINHTGHCFYCLSFCKLSAVAQILWVDLPLAVHKLAVEVMLQHKTCLFSPVDK